MKAAPGLKRSAKQGELQAAPQAALRQVRGGARKAASERKAAAERARGQADVLAGRVGPYAEGARKAVRHQASEAREWVEPRLEQAAETVQEAVQKDVAPRLSSALTSAAERTAPTREEARERGGAALAALKGEPPAPTKRRRWPLAMLFFLLGGIVGVAAGVLGQRLAGPPASVSASGRETPPPGGPSAESGHDPAREEGPAPGGQPRL